MYEAFSSAVAEVNGRSATRIVSLSWASGPAGAREDKFHRAAGGGAASLCNPMELCKGVILSQSIYQWFML